MGLRFCGFEGEFLAGLTGFEGFFGLVFGRTLKLIGKNGTQMNTDCADF